MCPTFKQSGGGGRRERGGIRGEIGDMGVFFWVNFVKSRNEIDSRLSLTEGNLPVHRAFCAREDADSSPVVPPVFAKCQLTRYVCVVLSLLSG